MAMELDKTHEDKKGHIRVVPTHTIVCIDIIEAAEKEDKKRPDSGTMFGWTIGLWQYIHLPLVLLLDQQP